MLSAILRLNRVTLFGGVVVAVAIGAASLAPLLARHDPLRTSVAQRLQPPSEEFLFGTDGFGRDIFSRSLHGARTSLSVGFTVVLTTTLLGLLTGAVAGYFRRLDNVVMRVMDGLMAFPAILLAIAILAALGPSVWNVIIALTLVYWPRTARIVRGSVLAVRELDFVQAAVASGATDLRIIFVHLIPNVLSPVLVQATFVLAYAILAEAGLSFVGAGVPPPSPSWGNILSDGRVYLRSAPWIAIFPGLMIMVVVLGVNLVGDGLRDRLDPRLRGVVKS